MKINGFVTLKRDFIWNQGAAILVRIEDKRKEYKRKIIDDARKRLMKKNFIQRYFEILFHIPEKYITDEQVWKMLEKEAENTFLGTYPDYFVSSLCESLEKIINEVMDACTNVDEMLVSSDVARVLNRGEHF